MTRDLVKIKCPHCGEEIQLDTDDEIFGYSIMPHWENDEVVKDKFELSRDCEYCTAPITFILKLDKVC